MATLKLLIQAIFDIRDALVGLHQIQVDRWVSQGSVLTKHIEDDKTDEQRKADAKALADHLSHI